MEQSQEKPEQQNENEENKLEPKRVKLVRKPGFADPETREKAMRNSQLARSQGQFDSLPDNLEAIERFADKTDASFKPTKNMLRVLAIALSLDSGDSIRGWFRKAGLERNTWYAWQKIPGFKEWWDATYMEGLKTYSSEWVKIGIRKMHKDFKYWNGIGKLFLGFVEKISVKEEKSEEEEQLTEELLKLIVGENKARAMKENAKTITLSDEDIAVLNKEDFEEGKEEMISKYTLEGEMQDGKS